MSKNYMCRIICIFAKSILIFILDIYTMNVNKLIHSKNLISRVLLRIYKVVKNSELPPPCQIGEHIKFPHGLKGIVIHPSTIIEQNVTIFHQVTCGRGDIFNIFSNAPKSEFQGIILREGCVLCVGAKVICNRGKLVVGRNTIVAANSVLTKSTGDNEIWAGVPAKLIKKHNFSHE